MQCGLDFGTSNCSLGIWKKGGPVLVPLSENGPFMKSMVYVGKREFKALPINQSELDRRVAAAIRQEAARRATAQRRGETYRGLTERQIETIERKLLRS